MNLMRRCPVSDGQEADSETVKTRQFVRHTSVGQWKVCYSHWHTLETRPTGSGPCRGPWQVPQHRSGCITPGLTRTVTFDGDHELRDGTQGPGHRGKRLGGATGSVASAPPTVAVALDLSGVRPILHHDSSLRLSEIRAAGVPFGSHGDKDAKVPSV